MEIPDKQYLLSIALRGTRNNVTNTYESALTRRAGFRGGQSGQHNNPQVRGHNKNYKKNIQVCHFFSLKPVY